MTESVEVSNSLFGRAKRAVPSPPPLLLHTRKELLSARLFSALFRFNSGVSFEALTARMAGRGW
jgi:hypothetical protein